MARSESPANPSAATRNPSDKSDRLTQLKKLQRRVGRRPNSMLAVLPDPWAPVDSAKEPTLWEGFANWQRLNPPGKRNASMETQLKLWLSVLGEKTNMSAVTELQVRRVADALPVSNATKNRYVSALGSLYKHARGAGALGYQGTAPTKGVRYDEEAAKARKNALTQLEIDGLLAAASVASYDRLRLFVMIALTTGMRRSNIAWLRWRDFDFDANTLAAGAPPGREWDPTKNGTQFTTILDAEVKKEALKFRGADGDLVFENTLYNGKPYIVDFQFKAAVKRAGLNPRISIHWLRHTAATIAARSGASTMKLMRAMNWKSEQMAKTYVHLGVEDVRDVAAAMGRAIRRQA